MPKFWCCLSMLVLLLNRDATTSSIAEEINFEVSNMRNSAISDLVAPAHPYHEMIEYEQDDNANAAEDTETSPSEIIETHVLPEQTPTDTVANEDDPSAPLKRPRRRRRRRRRKRPKSNPNAAIPPPPPGNEALDSYYTLPEEEIRRKPPKYRLPENIEEALPPSPENANAPRRRVTKRRRRPLKRPLDDYPATGDEAPVTFNNTDEQIPPGEYLAEQSVQENQKIKKPEKVEQFLVAPEKPKEGRKPAPVKENEVHKFSGTPSLLDDSNNDLRRRKRPAYKGAASIPADTTPLEETFEPSTPAFQQRKPTPPEEVVITSTARTKSDETSSSKVNSNDAKKDLFKFRRLPPTSAILRHVKIRPLTKNETTSSAKPAITPKEESPISNEILPVPETVTKKSPPSTTKPVDSGTTRKVEPVQHISAEESFEFPIISYTETKHPNRDASTSSTTTTEASVIYIPCNHTTNKTPNEDDPPLTTTQHAPTFRVENSTRVFYTERVLHRNLTTPSMPVNAEESQTQLNYFVNKGKSESAAATAATTTTEPYYREPKRIPDTVTKYGKFEDQAVPRKPYSSSGGAYPPPYAKSFAGSSKEIVFTYTSTGTPSYGYNEVDPETLFRENEISLHLRNNTLLHHRKLYDENASATHRSKSHAERKKLPLAVKSAIIISGAILALAVLGFFALLLSCKIRQAKSRMKCHRELYRDQFHNSEFRQSSRSTSPVVTKATYNGRSFTNSVPNAVPNNRNYYLWQTLRKTFQYD